MSERRGSEDQQHSMYRTPDVHVQRIRYPDLPKNIAVPMWISIANGYHPQEYKDQYPKNINNATVCFTVAGFGCQPYTQNGRVIDYFSEVYNHLNNTLDGPAPLLMHTIAFPGTEWDASQRHEHLSRGMDIYDIRHHPAILNEAVNAWIGDLRGLLPKNVTHLNALVMAHSLGGRALASLFAGIGGDGKLSSSSDRLTEYLDNLAQRNSFDSVAMYPILMSPAYGLSSDAEKLLRLGTPLAKIDQFVKRGSGTLHSIYRHITQAPFEVVADTIFSHHSLAGRLVGIDEWGFLDGFASHNDPHVLLAHARQLKEPLALRSDFDAMLSGAFGMHPLIMSGGEDRLINEQHIAEIHGDPNDPRNSHLRIPLFTHTAELQEAELVARLVASHVERHKS